MSQFLRILLFSTHLTLLVPIATSTPTKLLVSPKRTDVGSWGRWASCPPNQYVNGVDIKIQPDETIGVTSSSGLNGVKLYCGAPGSSTRLSYISSKIGLQGEWMGVQTCPNFGFTTGFQLKSDSGKRGANNIQLFCQDHGEQLTYRPNLNASWGQWTERQDCEEGQAICGILTQVDLGKPAEARGNSHRAEHRIGTSGLDATGIHNIQVQCCEVQPNCLPNFTEELIFQYDNRDATTSHNESYSITNGFGSQTHQASSGGELSRTRFNLGISIGAMIKFINFRIGSVLDKSSETYTTWSHSTYSVETQLESFGRTIEVPAGIMVQLWQPIVKCNGFIVKNKFVRRVDIRANETRRVHTLEAEIVELRHKLNLAEEECSAKLNETLANKDNETNSEMGFIRRLFSGWA